MQTTEELKRKMYNQLSLLKKNGIYHLSGLENTLEAYLEALRQDLDFACKSVDLTDARLRKTLQERDDLRNRLQAFEFANKAAGEELRSANGLIKGLRKTIDWLYIAQNDRESQGSTYAQDSLENAPETICGSKESILKCMHSFHPKVYGTKDGLACIYCGWQP